MRSPCINAAVGLTTSFAPPPSPAPLPKIHPLLLMNTDEVGGVVVAQHLVSDGHYGHLAAVSDTQWW